MTRNFDSEIASKRLEDRSRRQRSNALRARLLGVLSVGTGAIGVWLGLGQASKPASLDTRLNEAVIERQAERINSLEAQLRRTTDENEKLKAQNAASQQKGGMPSAERLDAARTKQAAADALTRVERLEEALTASPDKAIALPILRQQVDAFEDRARSDVEGLRSEIGRLYSLSQWLIGLIVTITFGLSTFAFSGLRATEKPTVKE